MLVDQSILSDQYLFAAGIIRSIETENGIVYVLNTHKLALHLKNKYNLGAIDGEYLYHYTEGIYKPLGEGLFFSMAWDELLNDNFQCLLTPTKKKEVLSYVKMVGTIETEAINTDRKLIAFSNCLFNVETEEVSQYSPDHFITNKLPYAYNAEAQCQKFQDYLSSTFEGNAGMMNYLQEISGYVFCDRMPIKSMFFIIGNRNTGKSTYLRILESMIGAKNCCNLQLEDFDSETKISKLFGKMANIVYESNSMGKSALESANLKAATGGGTDTLGGRFLYKDGFEFISYGKHFFGMNDFPAIIDRTLAVFARIYLVRFDRIFEGREQKKDLANEIIKDELPGIFNWAFAGLKRLRERGYALQVPESMNVEKIYFMRQGNPLLAFMLDTFEPTEEDIRTDLRPIYHDHYKSFMLEHFEDKKPLKSVSKFIEGVEKLGYKVLRPQRTPMLAGYRFREA